MPRNGAAGFFRAVVERDLLRAIAIAGAQFSAMFAAGSALAQPGGGNITVSVTAPRTFPLRTGMNRKSESSRDSRKRIIWGSRIV